MLQKEIPKYIHKLIPDEKLGLLIHIKVAESIANDDDKMKLIFDSLHIREYSFVKPYPAGGYDVTMVYKILPQHT